jgi:hypothetical protein
LQRTLTSPSITSVASKSSPELTNAPGYRAAEAFVRPTPTVVAGKVLQYGFDLRQCQFTLKLSAPAAAGESTPTVIFLPEYHFPQDQCTVEVTSGKWEISTDDDEGALLQRLRWWHAAGEQNIKINGLVRQHNITDSSLEDAGYLEQCQAGYGFNFGSCRLM